MRKLALMALSAAALSGCSAIAALDKPASTAFDADGDRFAYRVARTAMYGPDTEDAWLREYLADNGMCAAGYVLTRDRLVATSSWGAKERVVEGHCAP